MSIRDEIKGRVFEKRLFHLTPLMRDDPVERTMFVTEEINKLLEGPWQSKSQERRCGRLRADLESFVKGDWIKVCLTPFEAKAAYMARLHAPEDEVWDIRSRDPSPGLRMLGRFAECNLFIAITCAPRSIPVNWLLREPLKDRNSIQWREGIRQCKAIWRQLFPAYGPHTGIAINDYICSRTVPV